jgi:tol-pal system protein YbgF
MTQRFSGFVLAAAIVVAAAPAAAADKEQRQMMADLRMLQEQSQLLQNMLGSITDALKTMNTAINTRIDDQTNANRKALADQKLVIDNLTNDVRVIREKLDDNNVRIGTLSQELEALRQSLQQIGTRPPVTTELDPNAPPGTGGAASAPPLPIGTSPQKIWDSALSDYTLGQWDLAVQGFDMYVKNFPKSDSADDAQVYIGNSYLMDGKNEKAIEAYDMAIRTYPSGNAIPEAYYKKGLALRALKQTDRAREAFETVVKMYPDSAAAGLARQALTQLGRSN